MTESAAPYNGETALATTPPPAQIITMRVIEPFSIERYEAMRPLAEELKASDLIPKAYHGKPADIMLAFEKLRQVGLNPVTGLSGTYVVNGRVSIWGDTWLGVIQSSPGYGGMQESFDPDLDGGTAFTTFRRYVAGSWQILTKSFSMEEARRAKLSGKDTYAAYPKDMLFWRSRTRAGALFADVLQGLKPAEVEHEIPEAEIVEEAPPEPAYVPKRKSEKAEGERGAAASIPASKAGDEGSSPSGPAKAEAPESYVLSGVEIDSKGKDWVLFKINTVEGGPFYSKERAMADLAGALKGKAVKIAHVLRKGDKREATSIEEIKE